MSHSIIPPTDTHFLVTPGPTPTPESIRLLMAKQLIHHRTPEFQAIFGAAQSGLGWLFQTDETPLILTCSGTGAFEAALQTFSKPKDKLLAIGGGKFGERWGLMGRALGLEVTDLPIEWGRALSEESLREALSRGVPDIISISVSETSTGVLHDIEMLLRVARELAPDALVGVDAVSALGVHNIPFDDLKIDFMISGSQKALGLPPGLAFVCASPRSWERAEFISKNNEFRRSFYFDLLKERDKQAKFSTSFTPALTLVIGLEAVLQHLQKEGLTHVFARHQQLADYCRSRLTQIGCKLFAESPSNAVTSATLPNDIDAPPVIVKLQKEYKIRIAGGQDHLKSKLIRIGHLGFINYPEISYTLDALEAVLNDL